MFDKLPSEVRMCIFKHLFRDTVVRPITKQRTRSRNDIESFPPILNIVLANNQICTDATVAFLRNATIKINTAVDIFKVSYSKQQLARFRSIEIDLTDVKCEPAKLKPFLNALPYLQVLKLKVLVEPKLYLDETGTKLDDQRMSANRVQTDNMVYTSLLQNAALFIEKTNWAFDLLEEVTATSRFEVIFLAMQQIHGQIYDPYLGVYFAYGRMSTRDWILEYHTKLLWRAGRPAEHPTPLHLVFPQKLRPSNPPGFTPRRAH